MTDFFQLYRCVTTSMATCEHRSYYDPYHDKYYDYAFNEFYAYDGTSTYPGEVFYYRVKACAQGLKNEESSIRCSALSNYGYYTPPPTSSPHPPASISASDGRYFHYIEVRWAPSYSSDYYQLYRDGSLIAKVNGANYLDKEGPHLRPLIKYNYSVTACNALGCSAISNSDSGYMNKFAPISSYILIPLLLGGNEFIK